MKKLVVYGSTFGNTEKVAQAIAAAMGTPEEVKTVRPGEVLPEDLTSLDMLVVGSPTNGGRPLPAVLEFINKINDASLKNTAVAALDTRAAGKFVVIFGFAAGKIGGLLEKKGGKLIAVPEGFFVAGTKGPMKAGELERTAAWGRSISEKLKS